jgi:branched-chain amino acid transport system permease protein
MEAASVAQQQPGPFNRIVKLLWENILWILIGGWILIYFVSNPTTTLTDLKDGLSNGTIWALIALGYTLVYGIIELINFAHGEVFMIGSFIAVAMWLELGTTDADSLAAIIGVIALAFVLSSLGSGALNVMIERVAYRPLRNSPKLAPLITAIGMSFILQNVGSLWYDLPTSSPNLINSQHVAFTVLDVSVKNSDIFAVAVAIPLLVALLWFVGSTRYGKAMRATAQDPDASRLMGIDVDRTISLTFLIGGMLAGSAGVIYALYNGTVNFRQGFTAGLIAFTAAVMGGIGNLKGAVAGGLLIGVIQAISDRHYGQQWTPAVVFAILILVMVFKPQGLFGEEVREG